MSDPSSPPRPKPGSLRDRIAAFEQKPASSPAPPPAPRPKPGNLSQWKPRPASPPQDTQPTNEHNDTSMSASDAKESITKGGSLKERMAALQGLGVLGGGPAAAPPPKPAAKPKWKPPPQVAVVPPATGDDDEADGEEADNKPAISPLKPPSDDIVATLSKHPQPAPTQEEQSQVEGEAPIADEEAPDPDEEERQRRAAIAARMARLGGMRVGMGPPIFGRKPEIKPKPAIPAHETTKDEPTVANVPVAEPALRHEDDAEHAHAEPEVAANGVYICASCYQICALIECFL
jgi:myosin tail region-interacting protein MTI1